jgi:CBS domain containing-hemolysin-like protein
VGEIEDEFDDAPVAAQPEMQEMLIEGATKIRDFETQFEVELPVDAGFETVAGFILYKLGHIPSKGESVEYEGRRFTVEDVDRNRIAQIRVEKLAPHHAVSAAQSPP